MKSDPANVCDATEHLRSLTGVPLFAASLCVDCTWLIFAEHGSCPKCGSRSLINLNRVLNPTPELGTITFIRAANNT